MADPCYHPIFANCVKGHKCQEGYTCCAQQPPNGEPTMGLCVKNGSCNPNTGLCQSKRRENFSYKPSNYGNKRFKPNIDTSGI